MIGEQKTRRILLSSAGVLAIGSIVAKLLGAFYRIPLTNILGAEGMGMYQLIFPVYALFMTLSTAGIPTALSRLVAEKKAQGESVKGYLSYAMAMLLGLSIICAVLVIVLARQLAIWQGNKDTYIGFMVIAPSIIFVGVIAGFRGWFQGEMYMIPTAISNIIEQIVRLGLGIGISIALLPRGIIWGVVGALLGVTIAEFCTMVYMVIVYAIRVKGDRRVSINISKDETRVMFKVVAKIAIVALLMPLSSFFDSVIIVNMLKLKGIASSVATAQYGLMSGPVNSLVNLPIVIIMSLAVAIVPSVSSSRVQRDIDGVMTKSRLSIKLAYLIGIPCAFFFMIFAEKILRVVYPALSEEDILLTANILRIASPNILFLANVQIYVALIQALDNTKYAILSLSFAIIIKITLSLLLTRFVGILGAQIASSTMGIASMIMLNIAYYKICGLHLEKNVGLNMLIGVIMAIIGFALTYIKSNIASLIVGVLVCAVVYVYLVFLFNIVDDGDIMHLPFKRALTWVRNKVRFWENNNANTKT